MDRNRQEWLNSGCDTAVSFSRCFHTVSSPLPSLTVPPPPSCTPIQAHLDCDRAALSAGAIAGIVVGAVVLLVLLLVTALLIAVLVYGYKRPGSNVGQFLIQVNLTVI